MLLQAYDFLHLHNAEGVSVQLGGDDQWSNMLAGSDLVRRVVSEKAFCLTVPLLTTADGRKMGKTESGAVWLDPDKTSVFDFFQYWRNCDDASVKKCLYFLTDLPVEEVERLAGLEGSAINEAKIVLATEVTRLIHGDEEAERAKATTANLYGAGNQGGAGNEPEILLDAKDYLEDMNILELLVVCRIVPSKSEGRRLIQQGGLAVDGEKIEDIDYKVTRKSLEQGLGSLFKKGKKHFYRVRLSSKV
jgi:tyrosyl-tRNA synthetase